MSRMSKELSLKLAKSMSSQNDEYSNSNEYALEIINQINGESSKNTVEEGSDKTLLDQLLEELHKGKTSAPSSGSKLESFHRGESQKFESPNSVYIASLGRSLAPICVIIGGVLLGNAIVIGAGVGMAVTNKLTDKKLRSVQTLKSLKVHEMHDKYMSLDPETRQMFPSNKGFQIDKEGNIVLLAKRKMTYEQINPKTKNAERWIFLESYNGNPEQVIRCTVQQSGFFRVKSSVKFDVFETNHEKALLEEFSRSFEALEEISP